MTVYVSNLAEKIEEFLKFKHAIGLKYNTGQAYLKSLDRYNREHKNIDTITKELAETWAENYAGKLISQNRSWVSTIREFGRYLRSRGDEKAYVLDDRFKVQKYHADVYLLTEKEIQAFFCACDKYVMCRQLPGRAYILPALYRFLYCCGVRCCETRNLKCKDVYLEDGYVDILDGKGYRDRRLYLSKELIEYLKKYDKKITQVFPQREYFFPGSSGGKCLSSVISKNFKSIWLKAGLKRDGIVKPRAYDFRHHFACANIMRWSAENKDIHAMLPYLMRYMGHSSLESTYYYIHLIPDFFPQYNSLIASTADLIPEVEEYEI
ncbi:MAG: tyrosine-type recombinase/integrase [Christensenellales bacterium]|jgi:integrase/recombinase XerD|nr:tyrosine-type recombinase/integrase [Methanosarcina sp.]